MEKEEIEEIKLKKFKPVHSPQKKGRILPAERTGISSGSKPADTSDICQYCSHPKIECDCWRKKGKLNVFYLPKYGIKVILLKDVKEFIKKLKEELVVDRSGILGRKVKEAIDKLAGEKLT